MIGFSLVDSSHTRMEKNGHNSSLEELHDYGARWYFSRKEIEENSPSRMDGIDLKKETYFRKTYCTFLQDLGMRLKVPQVTIATAILFCHRFFLRQSHSKSDRMQPAIGIPTFVRFALCTRISLSLDEKTRSPVPAFGFPLLPGVRHSATPSVSGLRVPPSTTPALTIATVCMFLAGKVEETPRPLKDVILISYEIIHKKDPSAVQKIKQKEIYEQQKELVLLGERLVLATLGFDLNVLHPYKPLVEAIKKFKVAQNALAQVAWNFVNDGLRTSLFLQFKPHQIAAGAIFLAAKFLKVKLPSDGEKVWWQEFDVTPRQLEDVSNQMLELYEQNRTAQQSHGNEAESSVGTGSVNPPAAAPLAISKSSAQANVREGAQLSREHGSGDGNLEAGSLSHARETSVEGQSSSKVGDKANVADAITKIDKDKVKAALERRRKLPNVAVMKNTIVDEDDLIERELENGIELSVDGSKVRQEEREGWPKSLHRLEQPGLLGRVKPKVPPSEDGKFDDQGHGGNAEEGELSSLDEHDHPFLKSSQNINGKVLGAKRRAEEKGWSDYAERDVKRVR